MQLFHIIGKDWKNPLQDKKNQKKCLFCLEKWEKYDNILLDMDKMSIKKRRK